MASRHAFARPSVVLPGTLVLEHRLRGWKRLCAWWWGRPTVVQRRLSDCRIVGQQVDDDGTVHVRFIATDGEEATVRLTPRQLEQERLA